MDFLTSNFHTKSLEENGEISGYASVSNIENSYGFFIKSGAFKKVVESFANGNKPKLLWQHDSEVPIGVLEEMYEDDYGLFIKAQLLMDIPKAREAYSLLKNKAIDGISIGFVTKDFYLKNNKKYVTDVDLLEVSIVTFPSNKEAIITEVNSFAEKGEIKMTQKNETKDEIETKENKLMFSKEQVEELQKKMQDEMRNELKQTLSYSKEIEAQLGGDWAEFSADREALSKKFFALFGISEKDDTLATAVKVLKKSKELFSKGTKK